MAEPTRTRAGGPGWSPAAGCSARATSRCSRRPQPPRRSTRRRRPIRSGRRRAEVGVASVRRRHHGAAVGHRENVPGAPRPQQLHPVASSCVAGRVAHDTTRVDVDPEGDVVVGARRGSRWGCGPRSFRDRGHRRDVAVYVPAGTLGHPARTDAPAVVDHRVGGGATRATLGREVQRLVSTTCSGCRRGCRRSAARSSSRPAEVTARARADVACVGSRGADRHVVVRRRAERAAGPGNPVTRYVPAGSPDAR